MMFDWEEFLELADELLGRRGNPSAERSAISRAYYAAFHKASEYFVSQGERLDLSGEDHRAIWDWFLVRPNSVGRRIGTNGKRLISSRRKADYDGMFQGLSTEARISVEQARSVLDDVRALFAAGGN